MKAGFIFVVILGIAIMATAFSSAYIVNEGRVGVIVRMGQAIEQEGPEGLKFKTPFITTVKEFDVRERTVPIQFNATTSNQLSTNMSMTYNLRPDPAAIMEIYVKYGGPDQFMSNVVTPRLNQSSKATVGTFDSVQLARERDAVAGAMFGAAVQTLESYPVIVTSAQLDDYTLPERYWAAILDKEEQRERTAKERLLLEQQGVQSKQAVQTAEAQRDAQKAQADGQAYALTQTAKAEAESIRIKALAEAEGINAVQKAIANSPLLIEYEKAKRWSGNLPTTMLGEQPNLFMSLPTQQ